MKNMRGILGNEILVNYFRCVSLENSFRCVTLETRKADHMTTNNSKTMIFTIVLSSIS